MKVPKVILTVVASILMLSATAASASAAEFHVEEAPAHVSGSLVKKIGEETYRHYFRWTNDLGTATPIECESSFGGSLSKPTSASMTLAPTYSSCKAAGLAFSVAPNGCTWSIGPLIGKPSPSGAVSLNCPSGKALTWVLQACTIEWPGQAKVGTVTLLNGGSGSGRYLEYSLELSHLTYSIHAGCPNQVKTETRTDGEIKERVKLTASSAAGKALGLWAE